MTLTSYKTATRNLLKWTVVGLPFLSKLFDRHSGMPFPPIGGHMMMWRFIAVLTLAVATLLPHSLKFTWKPRVLSGLLASIFVITLVVYWNLESKYVVEVEYSDNDTRYYTIGSELNPDLPEPYRSMRPGDQIRHSGQTENFLEDVYTRETLQANRLKLYVTYLFMLSVFEFWLGSLVLTDSRASVS